MAYRTEPNPSPRAPTFGWRGGHADCFFDLTELLELPVPRHPAPATDQAEAVETEDAVDLSPWYTAPYRAAGDELVGRSSMTGEHGAATGALHTALAVMLGVVLGLVTALAVAVVSRAAEPQPTAGSPRPSAVTETQPGSDLGLQVLACQD